MITEEKINYIILSKSDNKTSPIADIITLLQKMDYYGAGECTEIAKGKHELVTNFKTFKQKVKRLWLKK